MQLTDPLALSQALIRCPSVTPEDAGVTALVMGWLESLGFTNHAMVFAADGTPDVGNLYARLGDAGRNFCFAGHLDVVPVGDEAAWEHAPFAADIAHGQLYGRGASDMKCAIACFIAAVAQLKAEGWSPNDASISLLLTLDEEGPAINGTRKVLGWLAERGETLDACLVGEPTSVDHLGDMVKIGRRGSMNIVATVEGKQGHVAYPDLAHNPVTPLVRFLEAITRAPLDAGTEFFPPSNLEVTSVDVGNPTHNIIPARASARLNIRFNTTRSATQLQAWLLEHAAAISPAIQLQFSVTGEAFLTPPGPLSDLLIEAVQATSGTTPVLSTTGGTSDARFIKDICPVVEFGMRNATAHKVDEHVAVDEITQLTAIYKHVLQHYFQIAQ